MDEAITPMREFSGAYDSPTFGTLKKGSVRGHPKAEDARVEWFYGPNGDQQAENSTSSGAEKGAVFFRVISDLRREGYNRPLFAERVKQCGGCNVYISRSDFLIGNSRKAAPLCHACRIAERRKRRRALGLKQVTDIVKGMELRCVACGHYFPDEGFYWDNKVSSTLSSLRRGRQSRCKKCADVVRIGFRVKQYGLTYEEYQKRLAAQNGVCEICGLTETQPGKPLSLDHDHKTGKFRGLICSACNKAMGLVKDNVLTLMAMVQYLKRHSK